MHIKIVFNAKNNLKFEKRQKPLRDSSYMLPKAVGAVGMGGKVLKQAKSIRAHKESKIHQNYVT